MIDIEENYPENKEVHMLYRFAHELSNYDPRFRGKVKHTYVLSPFMSASFGIDIVNGVPYLAVQDILFDYFVHIRWYVANIITDRPGLFLVFDMGVAPKNHPAAIRISLRTRRVNALSRFKSIKIVRIDKSGKRITNGPINEFDLPIKVVKGLDWEKFNKDNINM